MPEFTKLRREHIEAFLVDLGQRGQRPTTLANRYRSLQQFYREPSAPLPVGDWGAAGRDSSGTPASPMSCSLRHVTDALRRSRW